MKKKKEEVSDLELTHKVIDLCLMHEIEDSKVFINSINMQIENCRIEIQFLEDTKPFWFQKQKIEEHNKKIEELENRIYKYYEEIGEEVDLIHKMSESIDKDKNN